MSYRVNNSLFRSSLVDFDLSTNDLLNIANVSL